MLETIRHNMFHKDFEAFCSALLDHLEVNAHKLTYHELREKRDELETELERLRESIER